MSLTTRAARYAPIDACDVADLFFYYVEADPGEIAFIETCDGLSINRVITYGELGAVVVRGALLLEQTSSAHSDIALIAEPGIDAAIAYLIRVTAGCPPVMLPAPVSSGAIGPLRTLVAPLASRLAAEFTIVTPVMLGRLAQGGVLGDWAPGGRLIKLGDLIEPSAPRQELRKLRRPTGHTLFTSGSTGPAKRTVLSAEAVVFNAVYTADRWEFSSRSRILALGSPHHSAALMTGYIMPLIRGGLAVIPTDAPAVGAEACMLDAVDNFAITYLACPDSFIARALQLPESFFGEDRYGSLRRIIIGGEPLRAATVEAIERKFAQQIGRGLEFRTAYGMTEAAGLISTTSSRSPRSISFSLPALGRRAIAEPGEANVRQVFSSGTPSRGVVIRVEGEHGERLPPNCVGRVVVETPSIFDAYDVTHRDLATLPRPRSRRLDTGDLGLLEGNELYILGRAKESISGGERVVLASDVEDIALTASHDLLGMLGKAVPAKTVGLEHNGFLLIQETSLDAEDDLRELSSSIGYRLATVWPDVSFSLALVAIGAIPWIATSSKKARIHAGRSLIAGSMAPKFTSHPDQMGAQYEPSCSC